MATFAYAEPTHQQQGMANSNDFTLFPQLDWTSEQTFLPATTYQDQAYLHATTFDISYSQPAFAQPAQFDYSNQQHHHYVAAVKPQHPLSPRQSPTNSAATSFDHIQANYMSSVSESGASVQSTISSAMASPSVHARPAHEWAQQQLIPNIVQHDGTFTTTSLDFDPISVVDTKGFVGEFPTFSSSIQPNDFSSPSLSVGPVLSQLDVSAFKTESDSMFKSPITPASASSPAMSPMARRKVSTVGLASGRPRASSKLMMSSVFAESDVPTRPPAPRPMLSSHFFTQSSGSFIPPLESTCLSLSTFSFFPFFLFLQSRRYVERVTDFSIYRSVSDPVFLTSIRPQRPANSVATSQWLCDHAIACTFSKIWQESEASERETSLATIPSRLPKLAKTVSLIGALQT